MNLLQNAIDSITLGVEDYGNPDSRRAVSCTRNIVAGILLLFKHKLSLLSPPGSDEVLIKQQVLPTFDPSVGLQWQGKGKKTVDVLQIQERFDSLDIEVDWQRMKHITNYRNDIEHYFSVLPHDAVRTLITDSFVIIRDFIRNELKQDPRAILGSSAWAVLTEVAEIYEKEKQECQEHLEAVDWEYACLESALIEYRCSKCGSGLIDVTVNGARRETSAFICRSCGKQSSFEELASLAVSDYFAESNYRLGKDGDGPETITCPSCNQDTYVLEENVCILCHVTVERECRGCGTQIHYEELDGGEYCSWCAHMMSKDN
jgi:hypothetical protein